MKALDVIALGVVVTVILAALVGVVVVLFRANAWVGAGLLVFIGAVLWCSWRLR